jgi:hypothetical protein
LLLCFLLNLLKREIIMAFNTKQEDTNYTLMITRVSNGYVIHLLNEDGETVRSAIASEYAIRDYSSYSLCSAIEELWGYAEKLERDKRPVPAATFSPVEADAVSYATDYRPSPGVGEAVADPMPEAKESEL